MRTSGTRELKNQLSRALHAVQRGVLNLVTDRGRVVPELRMPTGAEPVALTQEEAGRRRLLANGELRVAERPRTPYRRTGIASPDGASQELLDWVRGT